MAVLFRSLLVALLLILPGTARAGFASVAPSSLTVATSAGPQRFTVELAITPAQPALPDRLDRQRA